MKNFEHQVWCINVNGVLSRLAGFNSDEAACEFKRQTAPEHPQTSVLVVVHGSELTSGAVGSYRTS